MIPKQPGEKLWAELSSEEVRRLFDVSAHRADRLDDAATKRADDLNKFLFSANAGAAAGIFILFRSEVWNWWHLAALTAFIAGVFFVGLALFILGSQARVRADGWTDDMNAWCHKEIPLVEVDARNRRRIQAARPWGRRFAAVSFAMLLIGGIVAGGTFYRDSLKTKATLGGPVPQNVNRK